MPRYEIGMPSSRRNFLNLARAAALLGARGILPAAQEQRLPQAPPTPDLEPWVHQPQPYPYYGGRSTVSLVKGESRRRNVTDALLAIDDQILPVLKTKKYVVLKPNCVNTVPLGTTNPEAVMGILDYLAPRFKGPVLIAESSGGTSSGDTMGVYEALGYQKIVDQHRSQYVSLVDLNTEAKYQVVPVFDYNMHVVPVRLAARLFDPDAYIICAAVMKTHYAQMATLSIKNMVLGAPLSTPPKETPVWSDKRKYHVGIRMMQVNMMLTAQKLKPYWGATVIDAFEGMEGNGPHAGTPVPHRIAMASTDYIAADRVAVEAMGIDPSCVGALVYCYQAGLGQYDLDKIDVRGTKVADVRRAYRLPPDADTGKQWMGPMEDLPPRLG
jgi:uncharacterized protein (DUF362 family)